MIRTLTGSNHFLIRAELDKLIHDFVAQYTDMGLQRFDGEEAEYDQIREALQSLPFLARKMMVVLRNPSANKEFAVNAEQLLGNLPDTTDLIIHEPKLDKRSVYYKFLKKSTDYNELNELDEYGLTKWLVAQAKLQGASLQSADAKYLVERLGVNQLLLSNELAKLATYNPKITRGSIDLLTEPTPQSTVFQLLDAVFAHNTKRALSIYQEQRSAKIEPLAIIGMLAWQLHILALIVTAGNRTDPDIANEAKVSPYVVRKSRQITHNLTAKQINKMVSDLLALDISLKTASVDADDALQAYLLAI